MDNRSNKSGLTLGAPVVSTGQSTEAIPTSRGSTRWNILTIPVNYIMLCVARISVREASPEASEAPEADLYNYDFKEKWEKGVEEAGMPKKYDQYDMNGYRKDHRVKNIKFTSKFDPSASKDSAFGK